MDNIIVYNDNEQFENLTYSFLEQVAKDVEI
jgi:hypothetical protein